MKHSFVQHLYLKLQSQIIFNTLFSEEVKVGGEGEGTWCFVELYTGSMTILSI